MENIFAYRLKCARTMRNMSMDELCKKMSGIVTKQSIHKYEKGMMMPDSTVLIAMSNALNVKPDYFFRPTAINIDNIKFRKKSSLRISQEKAIKGEILDRVERYIEIEDILSISEEFDTDFSNIAVEKEEDVYALAARLRKEWNLGEDGILNLIELLEEHNIKVIEFETSDKFDGLNGTMGEKKPVIVLNKAFPIERKRLSALHELGHALLKFNDNVSEKQEEDFCHLFANEVLIPKDIFLGLIGERRSDIFLKELRDIQLRFGISIDALMHKAHDLNIISDNRYKSFYIRKNADKEFKNEVEKTLFPEESSNRFSRLVYKALACDLITTSKAASLLNVPVSEVMSEFNLV